MYEEYWQLETKPFEPTVEDRFYYPGESHQGALLKLRYAIENHCSAALLAGPTGSGKTLLVETLCHQLPDGFTPRAHIVFPDMNSRELLTHVADELNAPPADAPRYTSEESVQRIKRVLERNAEQGRHAVLVIDEAHLLEENGTLETVRLLLNFTVVSRPLFTLLLVGQSELLPQLARSPGLDQRLGVKTLLRPFSLEETVSYVNHRLSAAGALRTIFEDSALDALHELSSGIPRRINRIADLALLVGYADQIATISTEHVHSVCEELVAVAKG